MNTFQGDEAVMKAGSTGGDVELGKPVRKTSKKQANISAGSKASEPEQTAHRT